MSNFKHILVLLGLVLLMSSCEKDWVCTCSTTAGAVNIIIKDAKKKEAEEVCEERAQRPVLGAKASRCLINGKFKQGQDEL